jgi:hypothetical protein
MQKHFYKTQRRQKIYFIIIFTVLSLLAFQVPISQIIGSTKSFTLFELIAPIGGMFLGPLFGGVSAFIVRLINIVLQKQNLDLLVFIQCLPAILSAMYFGLKSKKSAIIFPICIALFILNPIGRQAWLYSAIWIIPFVATFYKKNLFLNSLGSTFTAHAVGSVIYLYAFGLTPAIWLGLIPVVFLERGFFAVGIFASYLVMNTVLSKISALEKFANKEYLINLKLNFNAKI